MKRHYRYSWRFNGWLADDGFLWVFARNIPPFEHQKQWVSWRVV